jgi:AmmeMemoRadiSam system protein B/AmmeMemoRadiSam system protein A
VFEAAPGDWGRKRQPVRIANYTQELPIVDVVAAAEKNRLIETEKRSEPRANQTSPEKDDNVATVESQSDPFGPLELSDQQQQSIHRAACEMVAAAVNGYRAEASDPTLADAGRLPVIGCFVTLKRDSRLRACCGLLGKPSSLLAALTQASVTTATNDTRLPTISPIELAYLTVDVSLLHSIQPIEAKGLDRAKHVEVGKHGLQLVNGQSRGLLLPSVAIENDLDPEGFLKQVSIKAGLPPSAWKEDQTQLWTFQSTSIGGTFPSDVIERFNVPQPPRFTREDLAALAELCQFNIRALVAGGTPTFYTQRCPDGKVEGFTLALRLPGKDEPARFGQLALRPGLPLQSTALEMCKMAASVLAAGGYHASQLNGLAVDVAVLFDPAMHGTVEQPSLAGMDPHTRALMVTEGNRSAWIVDPEKSSEELLQLVTEECQVRQPEFARITSLSVVSTAAPFTMANVPRAQTGGVARPPAVAGMFYPADEEELKQQVDDLFADAKVAKGVYRAAMVPHAGWKYSGKIAADVLSRIEMPETILVIGPKHTRLGIEWAVTPHQTWQLPGMTVAADLELAQQLADAIPDLDLDAGAHLKEHAIEVELPLIARLAPKSKVVGIAIGSSDLKRCQEFGAGLAKVLKDRPDVLVVISSDMNHFANDDETRRLDEIALNALETLNPEEVFHKVRDNHISMCGVLPAVMVLDALNRIKPLEKCERVGYATTADVTGEKDRVVGYAGMLFA